MQWLNRHPDSVRSPAGLEWQIWKKLPVFVFLGLALTLATLAYTHLYGQPPADAVTAAQDPDALRQGFVLWGAVLVYWTLCLTVAIGCVVVMLMKGPAYTADSYPIPHSDKPD